ncbi:hypothetical protein D3C84_1157200 [compost metagenome]
MAGNGDQRAFQSPGHVFDKTGLATPGGSFEHDGQLLRMALLENRDLVAAGLVIGFSLQRCGFGVHQRTFHHSAAPEA